MYQEALLSFKEAGEIAIAGHSKQTDIKVTDIQKKGQKQSQNRQNQAWDWKERKKSKSKPKSQSKRRSRKEEILNEPT
ncbi:hypothetical protein Tco_1102733, partial [Tanacetum coccineum]